MSRRAIIRAGRRGTWVDLDSHRVDADIIREICREPDDIDPRGVLIRGAHVVGQLDLRGVDVPFPLRFDDCVFAAAPACDGARLHELAFLSCHLPAGLQANGVRVTRDLDLSGSRVGGALRTPASTTKAASVWLCEAEIGGRLLCVGTRIFPDGLRALQADRLRVAGWVRLVNGFEARGEIRMIGAGIDGSLDITGARIGRAGELSLDIADAVIGGSVFIVEEAGGRPSVIHGRIDMGSARIGGQLMVRDAEIGAADAVPVTGPYASRRSGGTAISGSRVTVAGDVSFQGRCVIRGGMDFSLGEFGHLEFAKDCVLDAPRHTALDLVNADLRSALVLNEGMRVAGTIRLEGASISGFVSMKGVQLSDPDGRSVLAAHAVKIGGDVQLQRLTTTGGQVNLRGAELGSSLDLEQATLTNPGGTTLRLHQTVVHGSVRLVNGLRSDGEVVLTRAVIDGRLDLRGGTFVGTGSRDAIYAEAVVVNGGMYLGWTDVSPRVDFTDSRTTILADDPEIWPTEFSIAGMTYERFGQLAPDSPANWDGVQRAAWLGRQASFDAGTYEQAARVFRQHGHLAAAEHLFISQRKHARRAATTHTTHRLRRGLRSATDWLYGLFGYGYRPGRAGLPLIALLLAVFVLVLTPFGSHAMRATDPRGNVYTPDGRAVTVEPTTASTPPLADRCGNGQVRCFDPFFYAVDTVVPLVSLGQRSTWYPNPHSPGGAALVRLLNAATLLGWILSSIVVVSFARLARNV